MRRATTLNVSVCSAGLISIHALLAESDDFSGADWVQEFPFLSTLSLRRATRGHGPQPSGTSDFYPRSPCGERRGRHIIDTRTKNFYPRSPCGERRVTVLGIQHRTGISIHALLAESDRFLLSGPMMRRYFYPRSPCGERRFPISAHCFDGRISIHALLAESDGRQRPARPNCQDFYPRSPCGERPRDSRSVPRRHAISIHALLAESDPTSYMPAICDILFLSTLSLRRATLRPCFSRSFLSNFYPRSPCGERRNIG